MANPLYDRLFGVHAGRETTFLHLPDGATLSHAAFLDRAARFAMALAEMNLSPGDRVAVQLDKSPDMLAVYAACVRTGLVFLPLNTGYTAAELDYFIGDSGAGLVLSTPESAEAVGGIAARHGAAHLTLGTQQDGSLAELAAGQPAEVETVDRDEEDLAAILYTSGTTGRSKGAMLTQSNLLSNAETLVDLWRFSKSDVLLHALPIFHTHGLFVASNVTLAAGGSMIFLPKFDLEQMIASMPKATALMGVPTFYTRLLSDPRFDKELTRSMRLFVSGSAPLLAETHRQFEERTGHRILERYGMTETNMSCSNPYEGERRPGTVGPPLPDVEAKVCDEAGAELPRGETGMLEVRGPNVFSGYWQMPEKTAEELRDNGFFITGDLASMSGDGYVSIVGRGKDLILVGGLNVYPKEIEEVLDAQPGVLESAVVGVPHPDMGEGVVAVLVADGTPDIEAIRAVAEEKLARFKLPRRYEVIEALPRNTMGKVQKAQLREAYRDSFA